MTTPVGKINSLGDPEVQLLLQCARTHVSPEAAEKIRGLAGETIDWTRVYQLAGQHGIRPLIYRNFQTICPDAIPDAVAKQLRASSRLNALRNLILIAELHRVLNMFRQREIPAIAFKGPALGNWIYGDPALREFGDLDIVVHEQHLWVARDLLTAHEYVATQQCNPRYIKFVHSRSWVTIDLQASLESQHFSFPLDDRELWARAVPHQLAGQTVLSFCREDLLILLSVHGTKDVWSQLKWVCDLMELMHVDGDIDWTHVLDRATQLRAKRRLLLGAFLAHNLLTAHLPENVLHEVAKERSLVASAEAIMKSLFASNRRFTDFERVILYFRTDDTARERVGRFLRYLYLRYLYRYLRKMVIPSESDRLFLHLPNWLSFAYYLIRPTRLFLKYGMRPIMKVLRKWFESFG